MVVSVGGNSVSKNNARPLANFNRIAKRNSKILEKIVEKGRKKRMTFEESSKNDSYYRSDLNTTKSKSKVVKGYGSNDTLTYTTNFIDVTRRNKTTSKQKNRIETNKKNISTSIITRKSEIMQNLKLRTKTQTQEVERSAQTCWINSSSMESFTQFVNHASTPFKKENSDKKKSLIPKPNKLVRSNTQILEAPSTVLRKNLSKQSKHDTSRYSLGTASNVHKEISLKPTSVYVCPRFSKQERVAIRNQMVYIDYLMRGIEKRTPCQHSQKRSAKE